MQTKEKILQTALSLFNQYGYGRVSMKDIADQIGVDRRNISYHFDKEGILFSLVDKMWKEFEQTRALKRDFPSFANLDKEVILFNKLQNVYAFVFKDHYVMQHPLIEKQFKATCAITLDESKQSVAFAIEQGNMRPEEVAGSYNALCETVCTLSFSWLQIQSYKDNHNLDQCRKMIWSLIVPYFTPKGQEAFKAFFGKEFYEELGQPFNTQLTTILF